MRRQIRSRGATVLPTLTALTVALALGGCGGSSGDSDDDGGDANGDANGDGGTDDGDGIGPVDVIEGDIARYGVINVADEDGETSDAIGAFYRVEPTVGPGAFGSALDADRPTCRVSPASAGGNDVLAVVYLPFAEGADNRSIDAGETLVLTAPAGTWTELSGGAAGAFNFYSPTNLPDGAVPTPLQISIPGAPTADGFPPIEADALPAISPLADFDYDTSPAVTESTTFTWAAGGDPASRVRLVTSTAGAFFSGEGSRVACLVPDTGRFTFPGEVREALGDDFEGEAPMVSRVAIATAQQGDSLLFLLRESFVE